MIRCVRQIEGLMRHGLLSLTWNSMTLDKYFCDVKASIDELSAFVDRVVDLRDSRIEKILNEIANGLLFDSSRAECLSIQEFTNLSVELAKSRSVEIAGKSYRVEEAVREMIEIIAKRSQLMLRECVKVTADEDEDEGEGEGGKYTLRLQRGNCTVAFLQFGTEFGEVTKRNNHSLIVDICCLLLQCNQCCSVAS